MAASAATLATFFPNQAELRGAPCRLVKFNGVPALVFPKENGVNSPIPRVFFDGILLRPALTGYSGTTGIQVKIGWSAPGQQVSGAARFSVSFDLKGQTDAVVANASAFPADAATNETSSNTTVSATAGAINYTSLSVTIAKIQNGLTTAPAIGDFFRLQVRRGVENAGDTIAGDIHIHSVELVDY